MTEINEHAETAAATTGTARLLGPVAVEQQTTVRTIASVYELDPPLGSRRHVVVQAVEIESLINREPHLDQMTFVYPSTSAGERSEIHPLHQLRDAIDHVGALEALGYRVVL